MKTEKQIEDAARRTLIRKGYRLFKTPARSWMREHYGVGYQIANANNFIVAGCGAREYEMSLEQVADFASSPWDAVP